MPKAKVFVVDDEQIIADLVGELLSHHQYDVETFYDANSALKRASNCLPDVLVADIGMPGIDGVTLAEAFRQQSPQCRIILISGNPDWRRGDLHRSGTNGFELLLKPFKIDQLLNLLASKEDSTHKLIA